MKVAQNLKRLLISQPNEVAEPNSTKFKKIINFTTKRSSRAKKNYRNGPITLWIKEMVPVPPGSILTYIPAETLF